jgi:hypothetical protein
MYLTLRSRTYHERNGRASYTESKSDRGLAWKIYGRVGGSGRQAGNPTILASNCPPYPPCCPILASRPGSRSGKGPRRLPTRGCGSAHQPAKRRPRPRSTRPVIINNQPPIIAPADGKEGKMGDQFGSLYLSWGKSPGRARRRDFRGSGYDGRFSRSKLVVQVTSRSGFAPVGPATMQQIMEESVSPGCVSGPAVSEIPVAAP